MILGRLPRVTTARPRVPRVLHALETRDFKNFQGMVNKALVLENRRGVMELKHKLVHQRQPGSSSRPCVATSSAGPVFRHAQPQFQSRPPSATQGFSTPTGSSGSASQ
jgi:hypothetical protein